MERIEKALLAEGLRRARGNQTHAARLLGLARATFLTKVQKYGLHNQPRWADVRLSGTSTAPTRGYWDPFHGGRTCRSGSRPGLRPPPASHGARRREASFRRPRLPLIRRPHEPAAARRESAPASGLPSGRAAPAGGRKSCIRIHPAFFSPRNHDIGADPRIADFHNDDPLSFGHPGNHLVSKHEVRTLRRDHERVAGFEPRLRRGRLIGGFRIRLRREQRRRKDNEPCHPSRYQLDLQPSAHSIPPRS